MNSKIKWRSMALVFLMSCWVDLASASPGGGGGPGGPGYGWGGGSGRSSDSFGSGSGRDQQRNEMQEQMRQRKHQPSDGDSMKQRRAQEEYWGREKNVPDNSNQQNIDKQYREREENRVRQQPMVE